MMADIFLCLSILISYILIVFISNRYKGKKITRAMSALFVELIIWCSGVLFQKLLGNILNIKLIYFDYITYIGICSLFPTLMYLAYTYKNEEEKIPKRYMLLYIVPIICLLLLWTNDLHNLFYKVYSTNFSETEYGLVFYINTIYSYSLAAIFIFKMINISLKKSGFLSMQTILMVVGSALPLIVNILGTTKIINISIYITPITFVITLICYAIAIFKYKMLNITPIALKTITDTMTDAFAVVALDGTVVDLNREYKESVYKYLELQLGDNIFEILERKENSNFRIVKEKIKECNTENKNTRCEVHIEPIEDDTTYEKFFEIIVTAIMSKDEKQRLGLLLLINDITEHRKDMIALEEKQEIIAKQAQLVSIGELAGGVAHDINTPISAIKTGITMLKGINSQRPDEEKSIIETMDNCSDKIINIVNSMRNQIRNLGGNTNIRFKISSVVNDIKCITYHEVKKYKAEVDVEIEDDLEIMGDPAKLGQVLTNLIMNAAQAYKDTSGGKINIIVTKGPVDNAVIKVIDFAGGIDENVASHIFKSMLTTKGTEGTGLGLYLAYSVIKGNFNGEINFDTTKGIGTTFYIKIPISHDNKK